MLLLRATSTAAITKATYQLFSTTKPPHINKILSKIHSPYRPQAIQLSQKAITDYLHSTRALPFIHAQNIVNNASLSLSEYISQIPFKQSTFPTSLNKLLRYHPLNEFQFFYESIGIHFTQIRSFLPPNNFFLSQDCRVFSAACALADFGFPWDKLGILYTGRVEIFDSEDSVLRKRLSEDRLGVDKEQVGLLLLSKPDIFSFDLEDRVITVLSLLKHFNLSVKKMKQIEQNYPYILGKNKMVNVPHIIRAMDLSEWFFNMIKLGDHNLLATYASSSQGEDTDDHFRNNLQKVLSPVKYVHAIRKLDFLQGIGFGENEYTMKVMPKLYGSSSELCERFNSLLSLGIKFSKLCKIISLSPTIISYRNTYLLEKKVNFLCEGMASSLEYLDKFPGYLLFDLENRIKPRYKFYMWLKAQGWCRKDHSLTSIIAPPENRFLARISKIHPDAPKKWFEFQQEGRKVVAQKSQST